MPEKIPDRIFKYRSFDSEGYYKEIISKNKLYFSSPLKFNDPFDCRVAPNYSAGSKSEIYKRIYEHNKSAYPNLTSNELIKLTKTDFNLNYPILMDPELFSERVEEMMDNILGICTLSEDNDNILMWSHYADCHRGFCIELNSTRLLEIFDNYLKVFNELMLAKKVIYSSELNRINPYTIKFDDIDTYFDWIILKSIDWEYEKEWRIIYANHPNVNMSFPDDIMKAIYFGVNCDNERIDEVKDLIKKKSVIPKLYKAKVSRDEFAIEFYEIK